MNSKIVRLDIEGVGSVNEDKIVSMSTHRMFLKDGPTVGLCLCGELNVVLRMDSSTIPKNAKLTPYIFEGDPSVLPLVWNKKSEFFIFSREIDKESGTVKIVAYDAIYKSEEQYAKAGDQGTWPKHGGLVIMTDPQNGTGIAERTGTSVCADTVIFMSNMPPYEIDYPGIIIESATPGSRTLEPDGATTMREVAGYVASLYGGNWIIDNNGEWRLVRFQDIPPETNYLVTEDGDAIVIGGVRILV